MMTVLQVSPSDRGGGAERIALSLHMAHLRSGITAYLAVGRKNGDESETLLIDNEKYNGDFSRTLRRWSDELLLANQQGLKGAGRLSRLCLQVAQPAPQWRRSKGLEEFDYPASKKLLDLAPTRPHVVHCHNLHSGYFDLRTLPQLSTQVPVMLTLHDAWLFTGHCAHAVKCDRWRIGCGKCPDLKAYPPIESDATATNWRRKAKIYASSKVYIATPSQWLMDQVNASMLQPAITSRRVIPNGIDLSVFRPDVQQEARRTLGLPYDCAILLFAANGARWNSYKDYDCLRTAVAQVAVKVRHKSVLFLAIGDDGPAEIIANGRIQFVPFQDSPNLMALYYQAADIYVHAAKAETFGNTITEAMACGTAVVATAVGGIPEQIEHGVTGCLTPFGDPVEMAKAIVELLGNPSRLQVMGAEAAVVASRKFGLDRMAQDYQTWYQEMHESWQEARRT
jgi:glycosyltransferase involved in cell wall biosynthesis